MPTYLKTDAREIMLLDNITIFRCETEVYGAESKPIKEVSIILSLARERTCDFIISERMALLKLIKKRLNVQ